MNTKPLSEHALSALRAITSGPQPSQEFNAGVNNKLVLEGLATYVMLPSPYARGRGATISFLQITSAGRDLLSQDAA